jgi:hypothetical protein
MDEIVPPSAGLLQQRQIGKHTTEEMINVQWSIGNEREDRGREEETAVRKYFVAMVLWVMIPVAHAYESSVRLAGMGDVHIAVDDLESEMLENPAEWLRFGRPTVLVNALRTYWLWNTAYWDAEHADNWSVIPEIYGAYERDMGGVFVYPVRDKVVVGCGFSDNVNSHTQWQFHQWDEAINSYVTYDASLVRQCVLAAAARLGPVDVGYMGSFCMASRYVETRMSRGPDYAWTDSDTSAISGSEHTLGLGTDVVKRTRITATIGVDSDVKQNDTSTVATLTVKTRTEVLKWLTIGALMKHTTVTHKWGDVSMTHGSLSLPSLGVAIRPDVQTIIAVDLCPLGNFQNLEFEWPMVTIGGERIAGKWAFRCGMEIYPSAVNHYADPGIGVGYHFTDKLHLDIATQPIDGHPHRLAARYTF